MLETLGCLNGGGQLREEKTNTLSKELFAKVEELYNSLPKRTPNENEFLRKFYEQNEKDNDKLKKMFFTSYHEVEKFSNSLAIKW